MLDRRFELSEEGLAQCLSYYEGNPGYEELESYIEQFRGDIMDYADIETNYAFSDKMDVDSALEVLNSPGWGYTTDALEVLETFDDNIKGFLCDYDDDYPDRIVEFGRDFSLFVY